ncbi:zinc finger protein 518A [Notolabrus celidotus]|uniref:zinc finger protein 518A n=1 Tax=Notolabrus celidotus TaxID=1203425 RepID=UPI00148F9C90|nr:zinc finger protein 518A [Notolabrus celidotus]XP_034537017.1 zinc finger protein 518A [Notolabrus celidotus]XP_034537018.1 zinc finger protein 518A [Notolabrus celidotus]
MDYKRRVNKKNRDWHKRLHLRKTAVQPPTMQSEDKRGPKKIAGERGQSTTWPSSKKPPQEAQQRTNDNGNTLRFTCSQCGDNVEYVPKDLVRHFEEKHRGSPPVFPCHMCSYSTHEFSYLQVHLLSHKDTFSSCNICNDNVQRTWPEFSAHLTLCHCQNGKFLCATCQKFSTGDVKVFLEHMYAHNLSLEGADEDLLLHKKDKNKALCCHHCGYKASHKWLITKHIKAVHVCQNGNQRREEKEAHSIAMKPNDPPIPKMKPRLTRSAVREMCWLTEDCLALPGKEFLDKYCHLSDPQTTLEETQQFLMKSVAGETGDQRWTKALKNVLSNVPQDMNLHSKSENGIVSNSSDLTVLTVKNKITVAQNGAKYSKRLKLMPSSEKETVPLESAADDAHCVVDQNGCQSDLNDSTLETKQDIYNVSMPDQNEPFKCTQMQENRENQEVKMDQNKVEHIKKQEETMHDEDGNNISNKLVEQTPVHKVVPINTKRKRRRRRKTRSKKMDTKSAALALKIVLKKNPVKEKQWVSQSSLSPSAGSQTDHDLPSPHASPEGKTMLLPEVHLKKWTKTPKPDPSEAVISTSGSKLDEKPTPVYVGKPMGSKSMDRNGHIECDSLKHEVMQDDAEKSVETEVDRSCSADRTAPSERRAADLCCESVQTSRDGMESHVSGDKASSATDGATSQRSYNKSSPESQPAITPQGVLISEDVSAALISEQTVKGVIDKDVPADSCPRESSPASQCMWQQAPKTLERTLKLVAINPSQLVKRPTGDQPVVVLNHPDADIPEVARIMEVINRYRGEVQKVVLSRRTANALSGVNGEVTETDARQDPAELGKNSVQERFLLKMRFRRLSRKKYEVVDAVSPSRDTGTKFSCWFCGRVFACQDTWMVHRQRHLMEWKRPNCENS